MDIAASGARNDACEGRAGAGPARRRRTRLLSGRRLSGAVPSGFRAGLDRRHFDRRRQCRDHRRQSAGTARVAPEGILGTGVVPGALESGRSGPTAAATLSTRPAPPWSRPSACPASLPRDSRRRRCGRGAVRSRRAITTPRRFARRWSVWWISTGSTLLQTRLSVGAVSVTTGNFRYFDNFEFSRLGKKIGPEHIMASGALPPGFPSIEIEGEHFWDGGIASNTPLDYVLDEETSPRPPDLPGRSVQRARAAAGNAARGRRAREGHSLFQPHPDEHRQEQAGRTTPARRCAS